jgi:hypothetical protein
MRPKKSGNMRAFGEICPIELPFEDGKTRYCLQCLSDMACQCAWCGKPIFIGDPITLYTPMDDFTTPEYAVIHQENPLQLVGCGRRTCADTGADYAGTWQPPGQVNRQPTMIELMMATDADCVIRNS